MSADVAYLVLARKYRPMRFSEMVGQGHITRTLTNAIAHDRVHHAYLFCGVRGLGKTTAARILARGLVCERGPTADPCNECEQCKAVISGQSVDVREIDGASNNSVEDIRALRERVHYMPQSARRKIYIIDEVHMLSASAFNALLKTLEEPPEHVTFIFATTDPHKVLPTIMSRVSQLEFRRVTSKDLVGHLQSVLERESVHVESDGLSIVARASEGSVRDALTLLDKIIAFADDPSMIRSEEVRDILGAADPGLVTDLIDALIERSPARVLEYVERSCASQQDLSQLALAILHHLRDIAVIQASPNIELDGSEVRISSLREQAARWPRAAVAQAFDRFARVTDRLDRSRLPRLTLEMGLLDLVHAPELLDVADIVAQLERLSGPDDRGGPQGPGSGTPPPRSGTASPGAAPSASPSMSASAAGSHAQASAAPQTAAARHRQGAGPSLPKPTSSTDSGHHPRARQLRADTPERGTPHDDARAPATSLSPKPEHERTNPRSTGPAGELSSDANTAKAKEAGVDARSKPCDQTRADSVGTAQPEPSRPGPANSEQSRGIEAPPEGTVARQLWQMLSDSGSIESPDAKGSRRGEPAPMNQASASLTTHAGGSGSSPDDTGVNNPNSDAPGQSPSAPRENPPSEAGANIDAKPPPLPEHFAAWEQLLNSLRGTEDLLYAVLSDLGLGPLQTDCVHLAAPKGSFAADQLGSRPEMKATFQRLLETHLQVSGYELIDARPGLHEKLPSLRLVIAHRERQHVEEINAEARSHPLIRAVIGAFDGRLREVVPLSKVS